MAREALVPNDREDGGREDSGDPDPFSGGVIGPERKEGTGGIDGSSAGDKRPLRVVDLEPVLIENRFFALGAEATRRINRDADAPMVRGERGAFLGDGELGSWMDCWEELAVGGFETESKRPTRCLSDLPS